VIDESSRNRGTAPSFWTSIGATLRKSAMDTAHLFRRLVSQSAFYRLLVFFLFIGFLKAIFLQMDYVFPKFGIRELGLNAPVGKLAAINAIIIIFLVPIVGALTQKFAAYRMVVIGGVICAAGVFIMALPTEWFEPATNSMIGQWLGHGYRTTSCLPYIWPYSRLEKRSTPRESMSMPQQLRRKDRKHRTAHWHIFHSLLARSLWEPADGCWLRFVPNTVRGTLEQCGLSLHWRHQSRQSGWLHCVATSACPKQDDRINEICPRQPAEFSD
jgi:hypothetical protein